MAQEPWACPSVGIASIAAPQWGPLWQQWQLGQGLVGKNVPAHSCEVHQLKEKGKWAFCVPLSHQSHGGFISWIDLGRGQDTTLIVQPHHPQLVRLCLAQWQKSAAAKILIATTGLLVWGTFILKVVYDNVGKLLFVNLPVCVMYFRGNCGLKFVYKMSQGLEAYPVLQIWCS